MARLFWVMTGIAGILGGCSTQAQPLQEGPALCAAAFLHSINRAKGTPLEADPQIAELQVRAFFEVSKAQKAHSLAAVQANVTALASQLKSEEAILVSKHCFVEEEMSDEYGVKRPNIIAAMEKVGNSRAAGSTKALKLLCSLILTDDYHHW